MVSGESEKTGLVAGGAKRPLYAVCGWMLELWNEKLMFGYLQLSLTSLHQRQIMPIISQLHSPNTNNAPGSQAVARSQYRCIIFSPFLKGKESASMTRKSTAVFFAMSTYCGLTVLTYNL